MKTLIILASLYGLLAAGEKCGLTIEADKDYQCSEFVTEATKKPGEYEVEGVTESLLKQLNPRLDCNEKIPRGAKLCVKDSSKFDDKTVQAATTLENFQNSMAKLQMRRSSKFNKELFDAISKVVKEQKTSRRKRNVNDPPTEDEKTMIKLLAEEALIKDIKAAIENDPNFKDLEEEFNKGRKAACAQLKEKEKDQAKKGKYRMCVCARGGPDKYPNGPPPFVQCQAILMKEKMDKQVKMEHNPNEAPDYATGNPTRSHARASKKLNFGELMTKIGCPTWDCLSNLCFSLGESCTPFAPPASFLSSCVSGELCFPQLGSIVSVSAFTESKVAAKVAICITGFNSVLSWIGLEACIAAIQLEYYYYRRQLDVAAYVGMVVIKVTGGIKAQVAESFSKNIGNIGWVIDRKQVDDLCTLNDHKCQHYCAAKPGELGAYVKVEYWWWGWREAVNLETKPHKPGCQ